MITKNRRLLFMVSTVSLLLLIPLIAMQFTQEVNWTIGDFFVAGIILFCTAFGIELILRVVKNQKARIAFATATILLLIVVWIELAVGLF